MLELFALAFVGFLFALAVIMFKSMQIRGRNSRLHIMSKAYKTSLTGGRFDTGYNPK